MKKDIIDYEFMMGDFMRLIATDMDGTLLNNNYEIPLEFGDILEELKERDILLSIATGRHYLDASKKLSKYKDDLLFICDNGAGVFYKGECLFDNYLDKKTVDKIVSIGREIEDAYTVLCGNEGLYIEDQKGMELIKKYFPGDVPMTKVDSLLDVKSRISKVNMFDMANAEANSYEHFKKYEIENVSITPSGFYWLDIMNKDVNKGVAIKKAQSRFNISYDETMVFGDYLNDLEMMESAMYSYAMKNGHDKVKQVANFETKYTNDENGVIKTIREEVINKVKATV